MLFKGWVDPAVVASNVLALGEAGVAHSLVHPHPGVGTGL